MLSERETSRRWQDAKRILCVRLDSMGDVLMTSPAIRALKLARPDREITLLTSPAGAAAGALIPEVDQVIEYEAPWMKSTPLRADSRVDIDMIQRLAQLQFDAAVIFTVFSQSPLAAALLAYLSEIPLRLACCRENPYQLLTDWVRETEPERPPRHEVRRQLDLVAHVGCTLEDERMRVRIPAGARLSAKALLALALPDPSTAWVTVHPGASAPSRRYPPALYAAVIRGLYELRGITAVLTGTAAEIALIEQIRAEAGTPSVSLAGKCSTGELAALLEKAPVLICNNTGPAHLAAAVGTPVVDLYALTNPQHTPWGVPNRVLYHDVSCKYCYKSICPAGHHNCLALVPPESVISAAFELLEIPV